MPENPVYGWKRYWVAKDASPVLEHAFFVEPTTGPAWMFHGSRSNGKELSELQDISFLALLGDVGMGKTTVVRQEVERLRGSLMGQSHKVVLLDLKGLSESQVEKELDADADILGWSQGEHGLTLFLDSLDECWRRVEAIERTIVAALKARMRNGHPALFLRVACRSAEWRSREGSALQRLFPAPGETKTRDAVLVLAPLSRANVRQAAAARGLDPDRLLERIRDKEAEAMASHPITLEMLLDIYAEKGDFPNSRVDLYLHGCERLCQDQNNRVLRPHARKTLPHRRLQIGGRLGALSVFTNRFWIDTDPERPSGSPGALAVRDVVGDGTDAGSVSRFDCDAAEVCETLQTGLFAESRGEAQTWRHRSYAEFLAAWYLCERGVSSTQVLSLLTDPSDDSAKIARGLDEPACWLAEMMPEVREALLERNAEILLQCDPSGWSDTLRERLLARYFELVRWHEALEVDWEFKYRFRRFAHANLAGQLRSIIVDRREKPSVRQAAIDVAGQCAVNEVIPEMVSVFLDESEVFSLRTHAGMSLGRVPREQVQRLLSRNGIGAPKADDRENLLGLYLQLMWPECISLKDLLGLLKPLPKHYFGHYRLFATRKLLEGLTDADLPGLLDWMREQNVDLDSLGDYGSFPLRAFFRAVDRIGNPEVRGATLRLLRADNHRLHELFRRDFDGTEPSEDAKIGFWRAVVASDLDIQRLALFGGLGSSCMLPPRLCLRLIYEYQKASTPEAAERWCVLVFWTFTWPDPPAFDLLWDLAQTDVRIRLNLEARNRSPVSKELLERARQKAQVKARRPTWAVALSEALKRLDEKGMHAYWRLFEILEDPQPEAPKAGEAGADGRSLRLAQSKRWKSLPAELREGILRAGIRYLSLQQVDESEVWNTDKAYRAYVVLNPLLVLLFEEDRAAVEALPTEVWRKWTPVLLAYRGRTVFVPDEIWDAVLGVACSKAKGAFLAAFERCLTQSTAERNTWGMLSHLRLAWSEEVRVVLERVLSQRHLTGFAVNEVFELLITCEPAWTETFCDGLISRRNVAEGGSIYVPIAIATLLAHRPEKRGAEMLRTMMEDVPLGRAVMTRLLFVDRRQEPWYRSIPVQVLAAFWEWLDEQYPGDPYARSADEDQRSIQTFEHTVYHFRTHILNTWIDSATPEGCAAMADLVRRRPTEPWLGYILARMRKAARAESWTTPAEFSRLLSVSDRRLIRTADELQHLLVESIGRYERCLHGAPAVTELWNELRCGKESYSEPKDEANLSSCLKRHLERDLREHGVLAGREVQIQPRFGDNRAQLTDLLVQVAPTVAAGSEIAPIAVVVEVKGAWNQSLFQDMEQQLFQRYLNNRDYDHGIYVVGYFTCDVWNRPKDRRKGSGASRRPIEEIRDRLVQQAQALSNGGKRLEAVVIDARLAAAGK